MSRLKNFSRNLAASYMQLGVNVAYSLASLPLILHWLPKAEFGLWATLVQLMSYIALVDLGINQAIARFLVDHKDRRGDGEYGALIKTSALVSVAQGLIVLLVTTLGSPLLADLMKVPDQLQATFINLMRMQGVIAAFTFCMNPLSIMLNAHQRMDVISRQGTVNLVTGLGLLWLFLRCHLGLYSFVYGNAVIAVICPCYLFWQCQKLGFVPHAGEWGKTSWRQFQEVFLYGKDVFLMNVGALLISASQIVIVSRTLGLEAAAAWSVGTKILMLARQILFQPYSAAVAGLCEMVARNEAQQLRLRFQNLAVLTASLGVFSGAAFALCNSLFVTVWTSGRIAWPPLCDVLLAVWLCFTALQCIHCNFVFITKQIRSMRYVYFVEGGCFVALAMELGYRWGLPGIIFCSVVCVIGFSFPYGLWRSRQYFNVSFFDLAVDWMRPSLKLAAVLLPVTLALWLATSGLPAFWRLMIHAVAAVFGGGYLLFRIGLPREILRDTAARLPRPAARFLAALVPCGI